MKYTVDGEEHSKTSLQRLWRERVRGHLFPGKVKTQRGISKRRQTTKGKRKGRVALSDSEGEWFVRVACLFDKQRKRLYGTDQTSPEICLRANQVFIDKASLGFGSYTGSKRGAKHTANVQCIFFADRYDPSKFRAVSSQLGDSDSGKDTASAIKAWLRQQIESQIHRFRHDAKGDMEKYKCALCRRQLGLGIESHVDHGTGEQSFKRLAERFQELTRTITLEDRSSTAMARSWQKFHREHCSLSLTCRKCNLTNK